MCNRIYRAAGQKGRSHNPERHREKLWILKNCLDRQAGIALSRSGCLSRDGSKSIKWIGKLWISAEIRVTFLRVKAQDQETIALGFCGGLRRTRGNPYLCTEWRLAHLLRYRRFSEKLHIERVSGDIRCAKRAGKMVNFAGNFYVGDYQFLFGEEDTVN